MDFIQLGISLGIGYLLGSIPFAVIIARRYGVNILKEGSGNPGATNVKRVIGKLPGNICFGLDFLKGAVACLWPVFACSAFQSIELMQIAGLAGAILGHSYSLFLKFRGGKGVAVAMGGLIVVLPMATAIGLCVWLLVFYTSRYVSLASILFGVSLPITAYFSSASKASIILAVCVALLLIIRHRSNISRLMQGTENRFEKKTDK